MGKWILKANANKFLVAMQNLKPHQGTFSTVIVKSTFLLYCRLDGCFLPMHNYVTSYTLLGKH